MGSSEAIPYSDDTFDVVVGMGLIEYFDDPIVTLREVARVTRSRGLALLTTPNKRSVNRFLQRHSTLITTLYRMRRPGPKEIVHREFTTGELSRQMSHLGFACIAQMFYDFKVVPYPITRISSSLAFIVNSRFEGKLPGVFANGYIGLFQKK